jgi:hypothetical protein
MEDILLKKDIKIISPRYFNLGQNILFLFKKGISQRAGIIPYVIENGKYHLLLGEKKQNKKLTDFGGGCKNYETPLVCGFREFQEETKNAFDIDLANITHVVVTGKKRLHSIIMMVKMENTGNEEYDFFRIPHNKNDELSTIEWIAGDQIKQYNRMEFDDGLRSFIDLFGSYL